MSFILNKENTDKAGGILILNITIDADQCILINLYNANTETEQVIILEELENLLKILISVKINALSSQVILISSLIRN